MTQEMTARLDDLDEGIRNLGKLMLSVRYDDLRLMFSEQMKRAMEDYSRMRLQPDVLTATSSTPCQSREACGTKLQEVVAAAAKALREDRPDEARSALDGAKALILSSASPCQDAACTQNAFVVLERAGTAVELFEAMRERLSLPATPRTSEPPRPSPQEAAAVLDPLSHPKRIEVLELLSLGERSFSEIGRAVGLKTGHLQFHLRPLLDSGMVEGRGRGRAYRLTARGEQALAGVADLMGRLSVV